MSVSPKCFFCPQRATCEPVLDFPSLSPRNIPLSSLCIFQEGASDLFSARAVASVAAALSVAKSWEIQLLGPLVVQVHQTSLFHATAVTGHRGQGAGKVVAPAGPQTDFLVLLFYPPTRRPQRAPRLKAHFNAGNIDFITATLLKP